MLKNLEIYKNLNILCVEDEESILEMYKEMFSLMFNKVYLAKNGKEGYEIFKKENIDLILTDQSMPKMSGLEMAEKIREESNIPIIMITAFENTEILKKAIELNINGFIKKPVSLESIFNTLEFVAKSIIAEKLLLKEQSRKIAYNSYQEKLTYKKELAIIKNEVGKIDGFKCDAVFKSRDILSGDSYSIRKFNDKILAFIIDGMGKGISASVTAMMSCAYINHLVDKKIFSLKKLIEKYIFFIRKNLLEEEVVSIGFLLFDKEKIDYALFSMPPVLYSKKGEIFKIKSNNPPLGSWTKNVNILQIDTKNIDKIIFYSDGLNENKIKDSNEPYAKRLLEDFKNSSSLEEFEQKRESQISNQEDDVTYIFCKREYE